MLNSESIVIIRVKGEHLLYSKISGGMIGYGWGNVCYIVNFPPGEYLLYSKVSRGIPGEGLLCGRFTIRHQHFHIPHSTLRGSGTKKGGGFFGDDQKSLFYIVLYHINLTTKIFRKKTPVKGPY